MRQWNARCRKAEADFLVPIRMFVQSFLIITGDRGDANLFAVLDTNGSLLHKNSELQTCERQKLAELNDSRNVAVASYIH